MPYDENYFRVRESWRDWRIEARELIRLARITPFALGLDIGCGGGGLMRMADERGAEVVGVDTLDVALRLARRTGRKKIAHPPIHPRVHTITLVRIGVDNRLPFTSNSFDAIVAQHVIEHIGEVDPALREWHRLLKTQGRLAIATPNACYPNPFHFADDDHSHIFTMTELSAAITRAGFVMEECFTAFPFLAHNRILNGAGVVGYRFFRRVPYFGARGRTILIGARKI